jgi:hypothetical protein
MEDVEREWDYSESSSTQRSHQFFLLVSRYLGMVERTEHWEVHDKARSGPQSDDEQSRLPRDIDEVFSNHTVILGESIEIPW